MKYILIAITNLFLLQTIVSQSSVQIYNKSNFSSSNWTNAQQATCSAAMSVAGGSELMITHQVCFGQILSYAIDQSSDIRLPILNCPIEYLNVSLDYEYFSSTQSTTDQPPNRLGFGGRIIQGSNMFDFSIPTLNPEPPTGNSTFNLNIPISNLTSAGIDFNNATPIQLGLMIANSYTSSPFMNYTKSGKFDNITLSALSICQIPSVGEWGLFILGLLLTTMGLIAIKNGFAYLA